MAENKFVVTEIPGPNVLKKVLGELGYSQSQIKEVASITPMMYPLYVYQNPETRYWRGSNQAMTGGLTRITWVDYLNSFVNTANDEQNEKDHAYILNLLESDLQWLRGKMETALHQLKQGLGS